MQRREIFQNTRMETLANTVIFDQAKWVNDPLYNMREIYLSIKEY